MGVCAVFSEYKTTCGVSLFRSVPATVVTSAAPLVRRDSFREVKLESGQVIGHVAETVDVDQQKDDVTAATTGVADNNVPAPVLPAVPAPGTTSTSPRNVPFKVLHLNPEQLKELNINLPDLEHGEGPVQLYIIEDSAAANVPAPPAQTSTLIGQEVMSSSAATAGETNAVMTEGDVERFSGVSGIPFQKSESGFYSMELDENGSQMTTLHVAGGLDSGVTDTTSAAILDSESNQINFHNNQSGVSIPLGGSRPDHPQPERDSAEDGVPPTKRRKLNSSEEK